MTSKDSSVFAILDKVGYWYRIFDELKNLFSLLEEIYQC